MTRHRAVKASIISTLDEIVYTHRNLQIPADLVELGEAWEIIDRIERRLAVSVGNQQSIPADAVKR
jgi:hypothetical protein